MNVIWNTHDERRLSRPGQVFLGYAHKDLEWAQRVMRMLRSLDRAGRLRVWFDEKNVDPGEEWKPAVLHAAENSDVGLLLVSADFLDSFVAMEVELPALARGGARLALVLVGDCPWSMVRPEWEDLQWLDRHDREGSLKSVAADDGEVDRRINRMCELLVDVAQSAVHHPREVATTALEPTATMRDLRPLCAARRYMEPAAAELAARHAGYSHCTNLSQTFATMVRSRGDSEAYRRADIHFHRTLFAACPDQCYASFDASVARILDCRTQQGLMPAKPVTGDAHAEVLRAVLVGDALGARRATQVITDEAFTAVFERRRMLSTWPLPRMRRSRRGRGADPEDPFT